MASALEARTSDSTLFYVGVARKETGAKLSFVPRELSSNIHNHSTTFMLANICLPTPMDGLS